MAARSGPAWLPAVGAVGFVFLVAAAVVIGDVLEAGSFVELARGVVALENVQLQALGVVPLGDSEQAAAHALSLRFGRDVEVIEPSGFGGGEAHGQRRFIDDNPDAVLGEDDVLHPLSGFLIGVHRGQPWHGGGSCSEEDPGEPVDVVLVSRSEVRGGVHDVCARRVRVWASR